MNIFERFVDKVFGRTGNKRGLQSAEFTFETEPINFRAKYCKGMSIPSQAVNKVASAVSSMRPKAVNREGEAVKHKLLDVLLKTPKGYEALVFKVSEDLHWGGYALLVFVGNSNSEASKIDYIKPEKATFSLNSYEEIKYVTIVNDKYADTYCDKDGRYLSIDGLKELVLIKTQTELPILKQVETEISILSDGLNRNGALLQNAGRMSMVFCYQDNASADETEARAAAINRMVRGKNFGGVAVTSGMGAPVDIKEFGLSPRDMDFNALYDLCRKEVFLSCGVPIALVSSEASTYNNMASSSSDFYTGTVVPMANYILKHISRVNSYRAKDEVTIVCDTSEIDAIKIQSAQVVKVLDESKSITVNEKRAILGYEAIDGGDALLVESRYVPMDELGLVEPSAEKDKDKDK